jgi:capsular polysaccharide biosynthesis protein
MTAYRVREAFGSFSLHNLLLAMVMAVLFAAVGAGYVLQQDPRYVSRATLVIDDPASIAAAGDNGELLKLNALRLKYAALATTQALTAPVARRLGTSPGAVRKASTVSVTPESLVMVSVGTAGTAQKAQSVAQAMADELGNYVKQEHERNKVPPARRFTISVVDPAFPGAKVSPTVGRALAVAAVVGAVGLAAAYVVVQLVRRPR